MFTSSPVFHATLMFIASASFDAFAITVDLTSAVNGSLSGDQGFYGTQAVEVGVVCPLALSLTGMTLREFSVGKDGSGSLGARIYDSHSGILIASSEATVESGFHQSITVPIFATLLPDHTYRVGFFVSGGQFVGSFNGIDVSPPGKSMTPYFERSGLLQIEGIFQSNKDAFPTTGYRFLPFISVDVAQAPEPL